MSAALPSKAGGILPIAGICCLALTGFLLATTIVLALIPLYVRTKDVTVVNVPADADKFQLSYTASSTNSDDQVAGSISNLADVRSALGLGEDVDITDGFVKTDPEDAGSGKRRRRRRSLLQRRQRLVTNVIVKITINIVCKYIIKTDCRGKCRDKLKTKVDSAIGKVGSLSGLPLGVNCGVGQPYPIGATNFAYGGIVKQPLPLDGFGPVDSLDFTPIASGDISNPKIWKNGVVPFKGCRVAVPRGITLSISKSPYLQKLAALTVAEGAVLALGTASIGGFELSRIEAVTIRGTFSFLGVPGNITFPSSCAFTFALGAVYSGVQVTLQSLATNGLIVSSINIPIGSITQVIAFLAGGGLTVDGGDYSSNTTTTTVTNTTTATSTTPSTTPNLG